MFRLYHTSYKHVQNVQFKILLKLWKKLDFQILLLESWVAWWVTSWRVREMTAFIVSRIFGACGWLHYTLRKTLFQSMLNSVYNTLVCGHSIMPSPRKCQILDQPVPLCHSKLLFPLYPLPYVTRKIVTNFFHDERP